MCVRISLAQTFRVFSPFFFFLLPSTLSVPKQASDGACGSAGGNVSTPFVQAFLASAKWLLKGFFPLLYFEEQKKKKKNKSMGSWENSGPANHLRNVAWTSDRTRTHSAKGMVITAEIKHHQLWAFSTFQCPSHSPFPSFFILNNPVRHSLRPHNSLLPSVVFPPTSTLFHCSTLPFIFLSFSLPHSTLSLYLSSLCFSWLSQYTHLYLTLWPNWRCSPSYVLDPHPFAHTRAHTFQELTQMTA